MESYRRPQQHAVQSIAEAGEGEHSGDSNVVKQHRNDQSSRDAAMRIMPCQPANDSQRQYCGAANAHQAHAGG